MTSLTLQNKICFALQLVLTRINHSTFRSFLNVPRQRKKILRNVKTELQVKTRKFVNKKENLAQGRKKFDCQKFWNSNRLKGGFLAKKLIKIFARVIMQNYSTQFMFYGLFTITISKTSETYLPSFYVKKTQRLVNGFKIVNFDSSFWRSEFESLILKKV